MTEADEAVKDKPTALANLQEQVSKRESAAIVDLYERAAWNVGATVQETDAAMARGRAERNAREALDLHRGWKLDRY